MAIINGRGRVGARITQTVFPTQFISTWKTNNAGVTASNQIRIPTDGGYSYNCTVDWGDGTTSTYNGAGPTMTHTYSTAGTYTVKISGTFPAIRFLSGGDRLKILEITNWGTTQWKTFNQSFIDCSNLKITAQDTPDFSQVTSFYGCFTRTAMTSFSFKNTNLSSCTDFRYAFNQCPVTSVNFTGAILNTSSNVSMYMMFYQAPNITTLTGFNTLNTSKVTDMTYFAASSKLASIDMSGMNSHLV
jgi:surface protein